MSAAAAVNWSEELIADIGGFTHDPLGFVRYAYPWGEGELAESNGPRMWQAGVLSRIGAHLANPDTRFTPYREAISSGHGIGKSALVGQIVDWAVSTCEDCRVVTTANTGDQLTTKTVPEVAKWFRLSINAHWWRVGTEAIKIRQAEHEKTWRADFLTWSLERTEAFAGLHNKGKRIVLIFDEASAIPDKIWEVAEGAMTDSDTEILWLAFGNPTLNTGRFRECFGKFKHRWNTQQIDSRTVEGTNATEIKQWEEDYGDDSDFFRVRVRGEFPRAGSNQFIPSDIVAIARKTKAVGYEALPKILSVDVARFGDDQTVIGMRQGRKFSIVAKLRGMDNVQVAFRVAEVVDRDKPDLLVIDGDGLGAGVVDQLRHRNYDKRVKLFEFHGGAIPRDPQMYFNRRAEVWGAMRDWLPGADIPDDPEMETDLTGCFYGCARKSDAIQLESKDDMKSRGLSSPDLADCLAMTFAERVVIVPQKRSAPPTKFGPWS